MSAPDLSVVIVNYNSGQLVRELIPSLRAQRFEVDGRPGQLEIILVDNASRREDHALLESFAEDGVKLVRNTENIGYALANEQGFRIARGTYHCVSNPDVRVLPGCFAELLRALHQSPRKAVVGPLASIDGEAQVFLPMMELPGPYLDTLVALARCDDAVARWQSRRRARATYRYWKAEAPIAVSMLSGGFFLGSRETFLVHGLFDPGYPLYYEDTDLFRRLRAANVPLLHVPAARIVHLYSRSALPRMNAAMVRNRIGARRYIRHWFGAPGERVHDWCEAKVARDARDADCPWPTIDLQVGAAPPLLEIPDLPGVYLEFSGNARFSLSAAIFPPGPGSFAIPSSFWADLPPVRYWARTVDSKTGDTLQAWRLHKCL